MGGVKTQKKSVGWAAARNYMKRRQYSGDKTKGQSLGRR